MKNVLVFFPHNPWPPSSGAHKRCLEIVSGLAEIGCRVNLASSPLSSDTEWTAASIDQLKKIGFADVDIYQPTDKDHIFIGRLWRLHNTWNIPVRVLKKTRLLPPTPPPNNGMWTPPGMRRWFARLVGDIKPDVVLMNYVYWDGLIDHRKLKTVIRIIDTHDFVSLNVKMQRAVEQHLPTPLSAENVSDELLREDFFERLKIGVDPREFSILNKYDYTIAITASEAETIERNSPDTEVLLIPMTQEPRHIRNQYSGPALLPIGPNLFNLRGYLYLIRKVLPIVRQAVPDFSLNVTGTSSNFNLPQPAGINVRGFVPDLEPLYESAALMACPVSGGTGQQVKIVESMAHGLPVVALRDAAARSPLRHEVNGLIAENADEFAAHVIRLWLDRDLCRKLGSAARETIAADFSRARLLRGLSEMKGALN